MRFNLIAPGVIDTPQYRAANQGADHERWKASTGVGTPEDVAGPLLFLLSDAATMTASILSPRLRLFRGRRMKPVNMNLC